MNVASPSRPQQSSELFSTRTACIVAVVLAAGIFGIYSPALDFQFVLDDHRFVGDPRLQSPGHVLEYFTSYVWAQVPGGPWSFYRPIFVTWLRLNFILNGMSPWGWHLLSIMKHLSVAVLLGLLVWKLLRDHVAALFAGTLFALHPAQTESVAWVTVPDPLMTAAVLVTLLFYLKYEERVSAEIPVPKRKPRRKSRKQFRNDSPTRFSAIWLIAAAAACLAAMMTKETAVVLPVILFAMALMMTLREANGARTVRARAAVFRVRLVSAIRQTLPFAGVTLVYLLCRLSALKGRLSPATQHLAWSTVLLSWPATLWFYVKVLLWPVRPRAFADPTLVDRFSLHGVVLPGVGLGCALAILVWACVWARRTALRNLPDTKAAGVNRALLLGTLILVLPIVPTLNLNALNPGDFLHGRYTYLPMIGLMILLATGLHLMENGRTAVLLVAGLVAAAFGVLTVRQESGWKDDLTIYTVAHQNAPNNGPVAQNLVRAHVQVALGLDEAGHCDQAVPIFEQAIRQYPHDWYAWAGLGECLFKLNDLSRAEQSLRRASELSHEPRVAEEWETVRERMGLRSTPNN